MLSTRGIPARAGAGPGWAGTAGAGKGWAGPEGATRLRLGLRRANKHILTLQPGWPEKALFVSKPLGGSSVIKGCRRGAAVTSARLESRRPQGLARLVSGSITRVFWEVLVLQLKDKVKRCL